MNSVIVEYIVHIKIRLRLLVIMVRSIFFLIFVYLFDKLLKVMYYHMHVCALVPRGSVTAYVSSTYTSVLLALCTHPCPEPKRDTLNHDFPPWGKKRAKRNQKPLPPAAADTHNRWHWGPLQSLLMLISANEAAWSTCHSLHQEPQPQLVPIYPHVGEGLFLLKLVCKISKRWLLLQMRRHQCKAIRNIKIQGNMTPPKEHIHFQ